MTDQYTQARLMGSTGLASFPNALFGNEREKTAVELIIAAKEQMSDEAISMDGWPNMYEEFLNWEYWNKLGPWK